MSTKFQSVRSTPRTLFFSSRRMSIPAGCKWKSLFLLFFQLHITMKQKKVKDPNHSSKASSPLWKTRLRKTIQIVTRGRQWLTSCAVNSRWAVKVWRNNPFYRKKETPSRSIMDVLAASNQSCSLRVSSRSGCRASRSRRRSNVQMETTVVVNSI